MLFDYVKGTLSKAFQKFLYKKMAIQVSLPLFPDTNSRYIGLLRKMYPFLSQIINV